MDNETEKIIFDAALGVFQEKGYAATKLKDIAERASINQSLLHYYFRKKEVLFKTVLKHKILELFNELGNLIKEKGASIKNMEEIVQVYHNYFVKNPNMPLFFIAELNNNPQIIKELFTQDEISRFKQKKSEYLKNTGLQGVANLPNEQLIVTFISIIAFPFIAKETLKLVFDQDESQSMEFLKSRGQFLPELIKKIMT
jgi:TetR/AcrR family transcriptional regulator